MAKSLLNPRLALPSGFPDDLFEAVKDRILAKMPSSSLERDQLGGGHSGVRYRLRACADYSKDFVKCVQRAGNAPPPEDRYQQERQLFGFFVSGIAALDSFNFFLYFTAAYVQPDRFPTQKPRDITLKQTAEALGKVFPDEKITSSLIDLVKDDRFKEWKTFRNILAHRSAPGRMMYKSFESSLPDPAADWKIDPTGNLKIDVNLMPPRLDWLIGTLAGLVVAVDRFTQNYL
jgi:hypothetical protein